MNPGGIGEEIGKTSRSAIDAMRAQPFMLAVLILNALIFGAVSLSVYSERTYEAQAREQLTQLLSLCLKGQ